MFIILLQFSILDGGDMTLVFLLANRNYFSYIFV